MIKLNDLTKKLNIDSIDEVIGRGGLTIRKQDSRGWCDPYTSTSTSTSTSEGTNNGGSGD